MSDDLKERLRANHLDECYEAIARISALEAALAKADDLEKAIMEDFRKESMETIRDLSIARRAYRQARDATR